MHPDITDINLLINHLNTSGAANLQQHPTDPTWGVFLDLLQDIDPTHPNLSHATNSFKKTWDRKQHFASDPRNLTLKQLHCHYQHQLHSLHLPNYITTSTPYTDDIVQKLYTHNCFHSCHIKFSVERTHGFITKITLKPTDSSVYIINSHSHNSHSIYNEDVKRCISNLLNTILSHPLGIFCSTLTIQCNTNNPNTDHHNNRSNHLINCLHALKDIPEQLQPQPQQPLQLQHARSHTCSQQPQQQLQPQQPQQQLQQLQLQPARERFKCVEINNGVMDLGVVGDGTRVLGCSAFLRSSFTYFSNFAHQKSFVQGALFSSFVAQFLSLREINFLSCEIEDSDLTYVFQSKNLQKLQKFILDGNKITDASVLKFVESQHFQRLKHLSLANNKITDVSVEALIASPLLPQLESLHVGGTHMTDRTLLRLLEKAACLKHFTAFSCDFSDKVKRKAREMQQEKGCSIGV